MNKNAWRCLLPVLAGGALLLAGASAARAQGRDRGQGLSERGFQEMRSLAHELDEVADYANDKAQHREAWIYRNDRTFVRSVARFADRARLFHQRMDTYRTRPWQVDDELRRLLRDANDVQRRVERARATDRRTVDDWNRVVAILNQMIRVYRADISRRTWEPWDGYGTRHGAAPAPPPGAPLYGNPSAYGNPAPDRGQLAALARDLAQRTDRLYSSAFSASGPFVIADPRQRAALDAILHLREQAYAFQSRLESGLDPSRLAASASHLAQDAREADAQVQQANYFPRIRGDWQEAMRLIGQIAAIAGA